MRRVTLNPSNPQASLKEVFQASQENDTVDISQNFSTDEPVTETYELILTAPTAANVAAVLATLLLALQKGGVNRTT